MLIRDVAALLGVSTDTVRYYEREGLLDEHHVTRAPNGYRTYGDAAVERLRLLLQARATGMTIAETRTLAAAFDDGTLTAESQLAFLEDKLARLDRQARELNATRRALAAKITQLKARVG